MIYSLEFMAPAAPNGQVARRPESRRHLSRGTGMDEILRRAQQAPPTRV